ncbi:MAG: alpha-1,2-fucosyltransferase [Pseudomonadota bacterium]
MIAVRIRGGLGNQLFQYACARALALRRGVDVGLDTRDWSRTQQHGLALNHFAIRTADPGRLPPARADGLAAIRGLNSRYRRYKERDAAYDPALADLPAWTWLTGYWQSERYFANHETAIRADLTITTPPGAETTRVAQEIADATAVSLHIRRGDYVAHAKAAAAHGILPLDYYVRAAETIAARIGQQPVIYAFSDDPKWVRDNLKLPYPLRFVTHNDRQTNYDDLRLMATCRHHIIANSSFSWWGAWLDPRPDKIVVAPKRWFGTADRDNPDITPPSWLRL